eukprot:2530-Eustigmatos_ZCMA.PRE.1
MAWSVLFMISCSVSLLCMLCMRGLCACVSRAMTRCLIASSQIVEKRRETERLCQKLGVAQGSALRLEDRDRCTCRFLSD